MKRFRTTAGLSFVTASLVIGLAVPLAASAQTDAESGDGYDALGELIGAFVNGEETGGTFTAVRPEDKEALSPYGGPSQLPPEVLVDITPRQTFAYLVNWGDEPVTNPYPDATVWCPDSQYLPPESSAVIPPLGSENMPQDVIDGIPWGLVFPDDRSDLIITPPADDTVDRGGIGIFYGVQTEGNLPSDGCDNKLWELGWGGDMPDSPTWVPDPAFPNDIFNGLSDVWVARCSNDTWGPIEHLVDTGPSFDNSPTGASAIIGSNGLVMAIPFSEVEGMNGLRGFAFTTPEEYLYQEDWVGFTAWPTYPQLATMAEDTIVIACDYTTPATTTTTTTTLAEEATTTTLDEEVTPTTVSDGETPTTVDEEATTTTMAAAVTTTAEETDTGGTSPITYIAIGGGLLIFALGAWMFFWPKKLEDCTTLYERWQAAQKRCDEVKADLANARAEADQRRTRLTELQNELERLKGARGTYVEQEDGTRFHHIPEGMVTSEGLEEIITSVEAQVESAQEALNGAQESVDRWQEHVDRYCGEATTAHQAYDDCVGAATAPPPAAPVDSVGGDETGAGSGDGPAATPGGAAATGPGSPAGGDEAGGGAPPSGPSTGGGDGEQPTPPECQAGETKEETVDGEAFIVPVIDEGIEISIEPPTEDFEDWWEEQTAQTGQFSPLRFNDPGLPGAVAGTAGGLDTSMAVAHLVTIKIPRQKIVMECIQHFRCSNGHWVKSHKEAREVRRERLSDIVISSESGGPKVSSADVQRLVRQAQGKYEQLVQADNRLQQFCT